MKIVIEKTPIDILELTDRSERKLLYEELESEFGEDIEVLVNKASSFEKTNIFDELWSEGYGEDYLMEKVNIKKTIEDKRYLMDKADEDTLNFLIEKYKYFGN